MFLSCNFAWALNPPAMTGLKWNPQNENSGGFAPWQVLLPLAGMLDQLMPQACSVQLSELLAVFKTEHYLRHQICKTFVLLFYATLTDYPHWGLVDIFSVHRLFSRSSSYLPYYGSLFDPHMGVLIRWNFRKTRWRTRGVLSVSAVSRMKTSHSWTELKMRWAFRWFLKMCIARFLVMHCHCIGACRNRFWSSGVSSAGRANKRRWDYNRSCLWASDLVG